MFLFIYLLTSKIQFRAILSGKLLASLTIGLSKEWPKLFAIGWPKGFRLCVYSPETIDFAEFSCKKITFGKYLLIFSESSQMVICEIAVLTQNGIGNNV